MNKNIKSFEKRKYRVRAKLRKITDRLRLSVFKSGRHLYAQIIDDSKSITLVSASTLDKDVRKLKASNCNKEIATKLGQIIAEKAVAKKISKVAFDKGGHRYHGVVKALADEARKKLQF